MKEKICIAIFPSHGLGDGLIQLVLAHNLYRNGYDVTYYHDRIAELDDRVEGSHVKRVPSYERLFETLRPAHLILYDSKSPFTLGLPPQTAAWLSRQGICYSMTHDAPRHRCVTVDDLRGRLPIAKRDLAHIFIKMNRSLRDAGISWRRKPIARQIADRVGGILRLATRTYSNGLQLPTKTPTRRSEGIVAIHPTSGRASKSWHAESYVELARWLERDGWRPVFTVAPAERQRWLDIGAGVDVPLFETIKQLAEYYEHAAAFIGNDSGNAHLASCLGVPNLVIHRRWRRDPPWRPGWTEPFVVFPRALSPVDWRDHVSVERVHASFQRMMSPGVTERRIKGASPPRYPTVTSS